MQNTMETIHQSISKTGILSTSYGRGGNTAIKNTERFEWENSLQLISDAMLVNLATGCMLAVMQRKDNNEPHAEGCLTPAMDRWLHTETHHSQHLRKSELVAVLKTSDSTILKGNKLFLHQSGGLNLTAWQNGSACVYLLLSIDTAS